jgi:serine phosphatase RsbU (regulator of sigma subunit)
VGGDWYDAVLLPDGRLSVAVGDVVGHDLQAAVTMGQLRNALRAFTFESRGPAEALRRLDRYCKLANAGQFATAIKVFYDPQTRHASIARAGHLPALLKRASGRAELVDQTPAPPLGFGLLMDAPIHEVELVLSPGDSLVFYSDGLVERREESIDEGLQRLVEVAASADPLTPEALCQFLMATLLEPGRQMDDVAVLVLQAL